LTTCALGSIIDGTARESSPKSRVPVGLPCHRTGRDR
jgi:hypothetical protein